MENKEIKITIRKATLEDEEELLKLVRGLYIRSSLRAVKNWEDHFCSYMNGAVIAEQDNRIVGYMAFGKRRNSVYIGDLYVLPIYRGKGIASRLLKVAENYAEKVGKDLMVDVRKKDIPAKKLYKKFGYEFYVNKNKDSIKLIKKLK